MPGQRIELCLKIDISTEPQSSLRLVKCYDGVLVAVPDEVIDHVERKHPEMLSFLGFAKKELVMCIANTLEKPDEVYKDVRGSKYFLKRLYNLYLNVIVANDRVRTTYLMGTTTYTRMGKTKWLHRLF